MKTPIFRFCLIVFSFLPLTFLSAQSLLGDYQKAMSSGDANTLNKWMDGSVQVSFNGAMDVVPRNEATKRLQQFFASNPATSFKEVHQGTSQGKDSQYYIGQLIAGDITWRTYLYVKSRGGKEMISEIRIER